MTRAIAGLDMSPLHGLSEISFVSTGDGSSRIGRRGLKASLPTGPRCNRAPALGIRPTASLEELSDVAVVGPLPA
jgi:hypothetical protein